MSTPSMSDLSGAYLEAVPADRTLHMRGRPVQILEGSGDSSLGALDVSRYGSVIGRYNGGLSGCCGSSAPAGWNAGMGDACCSACAAGKPCSSGGPVQALADLGEAVAVGVQKISNFFADPRGAFVPARGRSRRVVGPRGPGAMIALADLGQAAQHFELPGESGQKPVNLTCPGGSNITVQQATYGRNCNKPELIGNKTSVFAALCNGKSSCSGTTQAITDPDPAPGCPKSFDADWSCAAPSAPGSFALDLPPPAPSGPSSGVTTASAPAPAAPAPAPSLFAPSPAPSSSQDNRALLDLQAQIAALKNQPAAAPLASQVPFFVSAPQAQGPTGGSFLSPSDFPAAPRSGITSQPWFIPAAVGAGLLVLLLVTRRRHETPMQTARNWMR